MISAHDTDIDYTFYNDRVKEIIPDADVQEPFTYVPIVAGHMELVGGNALVFGNITEGYDIINPKVSVAISYEDISGELPRGNLKVDLLQVGTEPIAYTGASLWNAGTTYTAESGIIVYVGTPTLFYQCIQTNSGITPGTNFMYWQSVPAWSVTSVRYVTAQIVITLPLEVNEGDFYYITIKNTNRGFNFTAEYEVLAGNTYADVKTGLQNDMLAKGLVAADIEVGTEPNKIYLFQTAKTFLNSPTKEVTDLLKVFLDYNPLPFAFYLAEGNVKLHPALKVGASHGFGIVYKDRSGRTCSVMKTDDLTVYIPFYSDETDSDLDTLVTLTFVVSHDPPDWAHTFEIVYFGNLSMDYFLQIRADNITTLGADRYAVNIQQTLTDTWNNNNRWRVGAYEWQAGDRMRLVGTINESTGVVTKFGTLYDYEIEETGTQHGEDIDGDWLMIQAIGKPDFFGNKSQAVNVTGTLTGTVVETVAFADGATRKDTITLAGAGGTVWIYCGGLAILATFNATPTQTATDFASVANVAAFLARGIILTTAGPDLIFTMNVDSEDFPSQTNIIVEIYRPRKGLSRPAGQGIAYGTGMVFEIGTDENGYRYHKGDVDQVFNAAGVCTSGAEIVNTANDCWKFIRLNFLWQTASIIPFYAESYYPSDWWKDLTPTNRLTSSGFPFLDDLSQRQTVLPERLRHGGFIITGTRTNNIAHFTYEDFLDLPKKSGEITALREVGYTLKVLQLHKETSIYINRIENFNADGTQNFTLTDAFFGTTRPMEDDFGCQHPNSVMVNNRNLYYWDNNEGELIRSAPNGQIAISGPEYKMSRWFKELVKWIKSSGGKEILDVNIGANNEYDEVWITFRMNTEIKGLIFSEKNGRFTSRIDQITESYLHLGNFFAHLYHQRLWIMNTDENQDYLTWVGVPTYALLETVSNVEPSKNKVFTAIALFADHEMQSLEKYVRVPAEASGVNLVMETNVPIWDRREGVFYGEIMKDVNSKGVFTGLYDKKLNGNSIRGRYCFVKFKTEEHDEKVRIDSVVIFSTPSERNVK